MQEIGEILLRRREAKGITLKQIEQETNIRVRYLEAIERGEFNIIPGEVYVKGFIRNYANYLGLDGDELVKQYKALKMQEANEALKIEELVAVPKPDVSPTETVKEQPAASPGKTRFYLITGACVLVILALITFVIYSHNPRIDTAGTQPQTQPTNSQQVPSSDPQNSSPTSPNTPPAEKIDGLVLNLKTTEDCWTAITLDGRTVFEDIIEKNKTMKWEAKEKVEITLGNAGGVEVTLNGRNLGVLGKPGEVITKTFTKKEGQSG